MQPSDVHLFCRMFVHTSNLPPNQDVKRHIIRFMVRPGDGPESSGGHSKAKKKPQQHANAGWGGGGGGSGRAGPSSTAAGAGARGSTAGGGGGHGGEVGEERVSAGGGVGGVQAAACEAALAGMQDTPFINMDMRLRLDYPE